MTQDEEIEQLRMEKRVLITQLVKAQSLLRRVSEELWNKPEHADFRIEVDTLMKELRR